MNDFILSTATQHDLVLCYLNAFIGIPYMYTLTYSCSIHGSNLIDFTYETADFSEAAFQNADFGIVTFHNVNFSEATFQDVNFWKATFQDVNFWKATFQGRFEFYVEEIQKLDLRYAEFFTKSYVITSLEKTLFHRAFLENIAFIDCKWPKNYIIYEEKKMKDHNANLIYNELETIYRDLKQNMQNHGDYTTAGEFYYREMEMRRKGAETKKRNYTGH